MLFRSTKDSRVYVVFCDKINIVKDCNSYYGEEDDSLRYNKEDMLVIICSNEIPETFNNTINSSYEDNDKKFIVAFTLGTLQYNILNHELVPKHTILSSNEKEEVMRKFNITDISQFPTISRFDAVAKAIGMRPGEVCRIERSSNTSINAEYYRLCTK